MAQISLSEGDWSSPSEDVARVRLRNMYIVDNPSSLEGKSWVSRPTLTRYIDIGSDPIDGSWFQEGTLSSTWFIVTGGKLYKILRDTTSAVLVGDMPGSDYPQFAGTDNRVIIVRDGIAYSTDGTTITTVAMPDDVLVQSVASIDSFFLLAVKDSQRFYWIIPGGTDPDALDFASAERLPDNIISINITSDEIWIIGAAGPEVWTTTGNQDSPFQRINARVYNEGCSDRATVVQTTFKSLPCLIWVTTEGGVVLAQGQTNKISNECVEEFIKSSTNFRAWAFRYDRHDFYILTCDDFSYVYDLMRGTWYRWDSYELNYFRGHLGLQDRGRIYAADSLTGTIWKFEEGISDDGSIVIREVSGYIANTSKPTPCYNIGVRVNAGWSPSYTFEPHMEIRWSDDLGDSWNDWVRISLGTKGQYSTDTVYRSLGQVNRPGKMFEFRFTEAARFRLDYAVYNEV